MLMPVGQAALAQAAGPDRMGRVMSLFGVPMLLIPTLGPVLGGAIVEHASWRWIFYINVPVSLAAMLAAKRFLPAARPPAAPRLDLRGLVLLSPGIAALLYGMSELGNRGTADGPEVIAGVVAGAALVALFIWHASRRGRLRWSMCHCSAAAGSPPRRRPRSCSVSRCSARSSCSRCTTRSSAAKARCGWPCCSCRRASARPWRCRWPAGSPTSAAHASSCWLASWPARSARWPTPRWEPGRPTGFSRQRCSSSALASGARSCPAWPPRSRGFPASRPGPPPGR